MKLLYLYIEDYGCIKEQEFNFDSNYHFHLEKGNPKVWRIVKDKVENPLPNDFWASSSGKHNVIESVSAIVGENGSGKTTLAKFIGEELIKNKINSGEKYIIIFEQNNTIKYQYNLKYTLVNAQNSIVINDCERISSRLVYYSPFLTSEHPFVSKYIVDLSTTYLLHTRATQNNNAELQYNAYQAGERKASINFLVKYHEWNMSLMNRENTINSFFILPLPIAIRIIHPKKIRDSFVFNHLERIESNSTIKKVMDAIAKPRTNDFFIRTFIDYIATWCTQHVKENGVIVQSPSDDMHGLDRINIYLDCLDEVNKQLLSIDSALTYVPENKYSTPNDEIYINIYERIVDTLHSCKDKAYLFFKSLSNFLWEMNIVPIVDDISDLGISCQYLKDINTQNMLKELILKYSECKLNYDFLRFEFEPLMSSGEMAFLSIFSRIYESLNNTLINGEDLILFLDEAETTLHPEWQRLLVSYIIFFLEEFAIGHKVQVILASHSPILLSDIPDSNVVFLKKTIDGHAKVVDQKETGKTFASNIYTLFKKSFFMTEGLMGKFAEQKIDDIIKELIQLELNDQIGDTTTKFESLQRQISFIGEPVIRKQLEDRLNWIQKLPYRGTHNHSEE